MNQLLFAGDMALVADSEEVKTATRGEKLGRVCKRKELIVNWARVH